MRFQKEVVSKLKFLNNSNKRFNAFFTFRDWWRINPEASVGKDTDTVVVRDRTTVEKNPCFHKFLSLLLDTFQNTTLFSHNPNQSPVIFGHRQK
jgi:hypothetical protein